NLQIKNGNENDKFYWIYYASNGYVYFNNGSYDGCDCKRYGNYVEFKIPFGTVMNIYPGTPLSSVRVSIQDSANDWINVGELTGSYNVTDTFYVYSAERSVYLNENDTFTINSECSLENASYEWYKNNEIIENAVNKSYTIENASTENIGTYSVKITSENGTERIVDICNIIDVFDTKLIGDVNSDGAVNSADAVMLQKWLVRSGEITDINAADVCSDAKINVFDLCALKHMINE
ncbi:MAG: dockerin type I repeat-containing protein, partial [Oscillospiraceae bacterium]|nr:dockerin type I repeat-containing protein [Oscillospiraceae bacterium]